MLDLGGTARVSVDPDWLCTEAAERLQRDLVRQLRWEQRDVVLFGRRVSQPRLIAWCGELGYRYSGQTLEPRAAPGALAEVLARVVRETGTEFNHVLVNRYRDGNDGMGLHADDEPELGPDPVVASLSLGATRRFVLRPRNRKHPPLSVELESGTLLVMHAGTQASHRHGIPKTTRPVGERLSLTFRRLLRAPG
ncbi:MAG: alpha-ketoglutarate-dependent dioxygenase AlkB [Polyangiaceae bacterium]|nr:alpha-ketoglutarate-dependent dioxygenase AlkB [Polyangiaceae bacterium]